MARINPNTNRTSRLSLLEAGTHAPDKEKEEKEEKEINPLGIINTLLTLQEPNELIGWLSLNAKENPTKLIKFIVAVRDEYDKLAVDYNQLLASKNRDNTQNKALAEKQGVIHYLQSLVADFTAKNDTFRRL